MGPDKNFKLSKSTKQILTTMHGESYRHFKSIMIKAQLDEDVHKKAPIKRDKEKKQNVKP